MVERMNETYCNALRVLDYTQYRIECPLSQPIPYEYQGWVLLAFFVVGSASIVYGLYLMTGDKQWKQNPKSGK
jgi:hypothetical protein